LGALLIGDDMDNEQWHLDKKVPLGIIFALVFQTLGLLIVGTAWKTSVDARLERLEMNDLDRKPQESRVIRLEEKLLAIATSLTRIEAKLESMPVRERPTP
jgi:hypothetical protein